MRLDPGDVILGKVAALAAILLLPALLFVLASCLGAWLLSRLIRLLPRSRPRPKSERERLVASLPKTKAGQLFPYGRRLLEEYDRVHR